MSYPETEPLLGNSNTIYNQEFENPVTGQVETLQTIADYDPITDSDDLESLINDEHEHTRSCNADLLRRKREQLIRKLAIYLGLAAFSVLVVLEFFNIFTIPFGYIVGSLLVIGGTAGFLTRGSVASLMSGFIFGSLFTYGSYTASQNKDMKLLGHDLNLSVSVILLITGLVRSYLTRFQSEVPLALAYVGLFSSSYYLLKYFIL